MFTGEDFYLALEKTDNTNVMPVIPDIKCFSPKEGDLMRGRDPVAVAKELERAGAPVLSVVTEETEFHGSLEILKNICDTVSVPVLRKDFVKSRDDLVETVEAGASAILLMYSCLGRQSLHEFYQEALQLGLLPFVETHNKEEMMWAQELGAKLIGINNRDIIQLERDDGTICLTRELLKDAPERSLIISESSIQNAEQIRQVIREGAYGALVGTTILKEDSVFEAYRRMISKTGVKICGLTKPEDVVMCARLGVDLAGVVVEYPVDVPWNQTVSQAKELLCKTKKEIKTSDIRIVMVTGGDFEKVTNLVEQCRPDIVQLHYTETFEESSAIARALAEDGIPVIRSIPLKAHDREKMFGTDDWKTIFDLIQNSEIAAILLDSRQAENAAKGGGSISERVDILDLAQILQTLTKPVILGGGITADNVRGIREALHPDYIDVLTGVEKQPGDKSASKISELLEKVRGY